MEDTEATPPPPGGDGLRRRVAFVLRGAVSSRKRALPPGCHRVAAPGGPDGAHHGTVNVAVCANSVRRHIFAANPDCDFDVFVHSWSTDLEAELRRLYQLVAARFGDNALYADHLRAFGGQFNQASQALAIQKALELVEEHCWQSRCSPPYDLVILYRPDLLLWKDMDLRSYDHLDRGIYVNAHPKSQGDFHFVMSWELAGRFKHLLRDSTVPPKMHHWIRAYVESQLGVPLIMDAIVPGVHQEVLRKVQLSLRRVDVTAYGLTMEELRTYVP